MRYPWHATYHFGLFFSNNYDENKYISFQDLHVSRGVICQNFRLIFIGPMKEKWWILIPGAMCHLTCRHVDLAAVSRPSASPLLTLRPIVKRFLVLPEIHDRVIGNYRKLTKVLFFFMWFLNRRDSRVSDDTKMAAMRETLVFVILNICCTLRNFNANKNTFRG